MDTAPDRPLLDRSDLLARARRIELRSRRLVARALGGDVRSVFRGTGLEFESVREYAYGDDVRSIDWNVTARAGRPYVKRFVATRDRDLIVAVDRSASLEFGTGLLRKADSAAILAAILALVAARGRERVGLVEFGIEAPRGEPPRRGPAVVERMIADLARPARSERRVDWKALVERMFRLLRQRALVFLVSDFLDPPDDRALARLAARHEVIAARVFDPRERELEGDGVVECVDPEHGVRFRLDAGSRRERTEFAMRARESASRAEEALRRAGIERFDLSTRDVRFEAVFSFLARRRGAAGAVR